MGSCCNCSFTKFSTSPAWFFYCIFSWIIVLTDEVIHAFCDCFEALTILRIRKYFVNENDEIDVNNENDHDNQEEIGALDRYLKLDKTVELNPDHYFQPEIAVQPIVVNIKAEIARWYETKWVGISRRLLILSVENTVQFSYQYGTILFNHVYPNLRDVDDDKQLFYTFAAVRTLSIFFSTLSLISPIMDRMAILAYIHGCSPSTISVTIKFIQILSHLSISTGISLLFGLLMVIYTRLNKIAPTKGNRPIFSAPNFLAKSPPPSFIFKLIPYKHEYGVSYAVPFSVLEYIRIYIRIFEYEKCKFHTENVKNNKKLYILVLNKFNSYVNSID